MPDITFRPITADNWRQATQLKLKTGQENFVAPNWYTLLESIFDKYTAHVIYDGDVMVGMTMVGIADFAQDGLTLKGHEIIRLMIDAEHQNKGYGRAILQKIIADLKADPDCETIIIMFAPENDVARHLYSSVGFTDTGHVVDDEVVFVMSGK